MPNKHVLRVNFARDSEAVHTQAACKPLLLVSELYATEENINFEVTIPEVDSNGGASLVSVDHLECALPPPNPDLGEAGVLLRHHS